jgi:hypothetical protein
MSTSTYRSPTEQKAWAEGYNTALELAARRLEPDRQLVFLVEDIRGMMMADGPSTEEINAALGLDASALSSQESRSPTHEL